MVTQATLRAKIKEQPLVQTATYFGLIVEVIDSMPNLALVRYRNREFVVYTEDLGTNERSALPISHWAEAGDGKSGSPLRLRAE